MSTRNTPVLREIAKLEHHSRDRLLVDTGNVTTFGTYAEQLRLHITEDERPVVLDYIAERKMVAVTIEVVEDAINERLGWDRFSEP